MATTSKNDYKMFAQKYEAAFRSSEERFNSEPRREIRTALRNLREKFAVPEKDEKGQPIKLTDIPAYVSNSWDRMAKAMTDQINQQSKELLDFGIQVLDLKEELKKTQEGRDFLLSKRDTEIDALKKKVFDLTAQLEAAKASVEAEVQIEGADAFLKAHSEVVDG